MTLPGEDTSASVDIELKQTIAHLVELLSDEDITKQRVAGKELTSILKRGRDVIRDMGTTPLLIERLSSPDPGIREDMLTLLFRLAADEDQSRKARGLSEESSNGTATVAVIRSLWRIGPSSVACNMAAKLLLTISNIDKLRDSLSASGAIVALIDVLRYRKGLPFQKEAISTLMRLLKDDAQNKDRAAEGGIAPILLRLLVHGNPAQVDISGLLDLMAVVASVPGGSNGLNQIDASSSLLKLVNSGKLAKQEDKVANVVEALKSPKSDPNLESSTAPDLEEVLPIPIGDDGNSGGERGKIDITTNDGYYGEISTKAVTLATAPPLANGNRSTTTEEINRALEDIRTYDRDVIQKWLDKGERRCPSTQQRLTHLNLKSNYILKLKIKEWCEENGVEITSSLASQQEYRAPDPVNTEEPNGVITDDDSESVNDEEQDEHENEQPATLAELAKIQSLVETLQSNDASEEELRRAAIELQDLGFNSSPLRDEMVIAGAVGPLASLLSNEYSDSTQEAAINALLVLSLNDENKRRMADRLSPAVPAIVSLLRFGSEDAREKAASTLFSLSILDENKVSIGATCTRAIPALVEVLSGSDPLFSHRAQKDAATGLLTLCLYQGNKAQAVRAGAVPHLVALMDDESLRDLAVALLAVLSSHSEGRAAIEAVNLLPKLAQLMESSSDRTLVENALTIFSRLIMRNPGLIAEAQRLGADEIVRDLWEASGPGKIKTKALLLMEFVERHERQARIAMNSG